MSLLSARAWLLMTLLGVVAGLVVTVGTLQWIGRPFAGFRYMPFEVVSSGALSTWGGPRAGLQPDDRVLSVNGAPLSSPDALRRQVLAAPAGTPFRYEVAREGGAKTVEVPTQPFSFSDYGLTNAPYLVLGFLYLVIGAVPYCLRPEDRGARVHLVWTALLGTLFFLTIDIDTSQWLHGLYFPVILWSAAATCHLALVFPRPFALLERRPAVALLPAAVLGPGGLAAGGAYGLLVQRYGPGQGEAMVLLNHGTLLVLALSAFFLLGAIAWKAAVATSSASRGQAAVVLWGSALAFLPYLLLWAVPFVLGRSDASTDFWFNVAIVAFGLFPASIAVAIVKYNLFDITLIIKRTLTYAFSTAVALAGYFLLSAGLKALFHSTDLLSQAISTAAIALAFAPLRDRTRAVLDRLFDRTRYDLGQIVGAYNATARQTVAIPALTDAYASAIEEAIKPRALAILLDGAPVFVAGYASESVTSLRDGETPEGALSLPLQAGETRIGRVVVGAKKSDQAFFPLDHQLLDSLTQALALSVSNAQLFEQLAGQERLQRELEIATEMQMGFLPKRLPAVHGALVSASCTPALEVGGDFYDFIQIDPYRWGMIIGDVCGKGVPAALMMAASLTIFRAVAPSVPSPASTLNRMNKLINRNRPNNKVFVTAIYLIYDCRDGSVLIANAGQPKPLLNGHAVEIKGMPLGVNFRMKFKETKVVLGALDTLVAYSDGLEDVESEAGAQFGPDRVLRFFEEHARRRPEEARTRLEETLRAFSGQAPAADDLTLIMLQRQADVQPLEVTGGTQPALARDRAGTKPIEAGTPATAPLAPSKDTRTL